MGLMALAASLWLLPAGGAALAGKATPSTPEDLGPAEIEVSSYPGEYQRTYRDVFVPVFNVLGGTARAVNSPIIELDSHLEEQERRESPELFGNPKIAEISRDGWRKRVEEIYHRPACCGACPVLTREKAKALWRFLAYDSLRRKTGRQAPVWLALRRSLIQRFEERQYIAKETEK